MTKTIAVNGANVDAMRNVLHTELKTLAAELAAAQLKIAGLETLIDLAEQELQFDIRKKSGTKQSK